MCPATTSFPRSQPAVPPIGYAQQPRRVPSGHPLRTSRLGTCIQYITVLAAPNCGFLRKPANLCQNPRCTADADMKGTTPATPPSCLQRGQPNRGFRLGVSGAHQSRPHANVLTVDGRRVTMTATRAIPMPWSPLWFSMGLQGNLCDDVQDYLQYIMGGYNCQGVNSRQNFRERLALTCLTTVADLVLLGRPQSAHGGAVDCGPP